MGRVPPPRTECQGTLPRSWLPAHVDSYRNWGRCRFPGSLSPVGGCTECTAPGFNAVASVSICRMDTYFLSAVAQVITNEKQLPWTVWVACPCAPGSHCAFSLLPGQLTVSRAWLQSVLGLCVRTRRYPGCSSWPPALCAITRHAHWDHIH